MTIIIYYEYKRIFLMGQAMKSKKLLVIIMIVILAIAILAGCNNKTDYDENIVANGNFENYNSQETLAEGWTIKPGTTPIWMRNE